MVRGAIILLTWLLYLVPAVADTLEHGSGQRVVGLIASGNGPNPQWSVALSASSVTFRNQSDGTTGTKYNTGTVVANLAASLPAWSEGYIYFIWGSGPGIGATVSGAAPNTGPTLPAGYTHYAYAYSVRITSSGSMPSGIEVIGNKVKFFEFPYTIICETTAGCPTTSAWNLATWPHLPSNATEVCIWWDAEVYSNNTSGPDNIAFVIFGMAPFQVFTKPGVVYPMNLTLCHSIKPPGDIAWQWYAGTGYSAFNKLLLGVRFLSYTVPNGG